MLKKLSKIISVAQTSKSEAVMSVSPEFLYCLLHFIFIFRQFFYLFLKILDVLRFTRVVPRVVASIYQAGEKKEDCKSLFH